MNSKNILQQLNQQFNFFEQCRQYNLGLWQCPAFLTIIMGSVTIAAMLGTYFIANYFSSDPEISALIVIITTIVLFIISYLIINSFAHLAEANRMKSEFIGITSHQLRTPLSSLKWSLNLLMDEHLGKIDEEQKEYLRIIRDSNERMIKLVNDLLDVSRIEQGRLTLRPQKFSLIDLVKGLLVELTPLAEGNKIEMRLETKNRLPEVRADAERISLAIQNLLDNAIKYSFEKGLVKIKLFPQGKYVRCEIQDEGLGIPKDQQKQVFQKFFRSDNVRRYQTEGTGLGLFIAKGIIDASGGEIGFKSQENNGSTFWFTLPIANK